MNFSAFSVWTQEEPGLNFTYGAVGSESVITNIFFGGVFDH